MEKRLLIRHLYSPVQPAVQKKGGRVSYNEFLPDSRLQHLIYCYWQLKSEQCLGSPFYYRVAADGCMDVFFEYDDPAESFVAGYADTYSGFPLQTSFNYIGIRFLPAAFPQLFRMKASELSRSVEQLENVSPTFSEFIKQAFEKPAIQHRIKSIFDDYFLTLARNAENDSDVRLQRALHGIFEARGNLRIEKDLDIHLSKRQLRRLFNHYIGGTPKSFSRIVRFQHTLKSAASPVTAKHSFIEAGYSDQAHLIREFRHFYGLTPARLLSE